MDPNPTKTEARYVNYIRLYRAGHGNLGPSYKELMSAFNVKKSTVQSTLKNLRAKGWVDWEPFLPRTLKVTKEV